MANRSTFGSLEPFFLDTEGGFTAYMEHVRLILEANEVSEANQSSLKKRNSKFQKHISRSLYAANFLYTRVVLFIQQTYIT